MYHLALCVGFCLRGNLQAAWNRIHIPANSPLFSITGELFNGLVFLMSAGGSETHSSHKPVPRSIRFYLFAFAIGGHGKVILCAADPVVANRRTCRLHRKLT